MSRRIVRTLADIHRADLAPVTTNRATLTLLAFRLSRSRSSRLVKQYSSARSGRDSVFLRPPIQVQSSSLVIDLVATCNELVHPFLTLDGGFDTQVVRRARIRIRFHSRHRSRARCVIVPD